MNQDIISNILFFLPINNIAATATINKSFCSAQTNEFMWLQIRYKLLLTAAKLPHKFKIVINAIIKNEISKSIKTDSRFTFS